MPVISFFSDANEIHGHRPGRREGRTPRLLAALRSEGDCSLPPHALPLEPPKAKPGHPPPGNSVWSVPEWE